MPARHCGRRASTIATNNRPRISSNLSPVRSTEIYGAIECVVADQLRPAMESLEAASRVTAEELREQHREQQALLRRLRGRL